MTEVYNLDFIKLFNKENVDIDSIEWYETSKINYTLSKRKMFTIKNKGTTHNTFFPFDEFRRINLKLNCYYIAGYSDLDDFTEIKDEYQIGFNNLGETFEYSFLFENISKDYDICTLIGSSNWNIKGKFDTIFDCHSESFIGKKYDLQYCNNACNDYILRLKNISEFKSIKNYIKGYLISPIREFPIYSDIQISNVSDIKTLHLLANYFSIIIARSPIYSSYNLVTYSKDKIGLLLAEKIKYSCNIHKLVYME